MKGRVIATPSKSARKRKASPHSVSRTTRPRKKRGPTRRVVSSEDEDDQGDDPDDDETHVPRKRRGSLNESESSEESSDDSPHKMVKKKRPREGSPNTNLLSVPDGQSLRTTKSREARDITHFFERGDKKTGRKTICILCR